MRLQLKWPRWSWATWVIIVLNVFTYSLMFAVTILAGQSIGLIHVPQTEYRLVSPNEAMELVNNEGWRVSDRVRMTDQAVYVYRRH